jgi:class 3 adenylate cyclase/pimeloyl-ACP methyl ester carboxylesterase
MLDTGVHMEALIQYARTSDGVDIAFATYGSGPPIVVPPNIMNSHLQVELEGPFVRFFIEQLSKRLRVIRYGCCGIGMSDRAAVDFSPEAAQRDLEAVLDRLGIEEFALYNHVMAGEGPMAFAANHPERVTGIVFWVGQTVQISPDTVRRLRALDPLMVAEWELYTEILGRLVWGWDSPHAGWHAALTRAATTPSTYQASSRAFLQSRDSSWAARLTVPTLVMHLAGADEPTNIARRWASNIPGARVMAVPGSPTMLMPYVNDNEILLTAIADFTESLAAGNDAPVPLPELQLSAMRAILWTDLVGHTPIMQRLGDDRGRALLREHERMTREALATHGGTEVKTMGDAFMAWFPSAQQALLCATALQRAFAQRNESATEPLQVRVGVNAGEPVVEESDLFGSSVIAAARICQEADGGQIVVSDVVRQLVAGKGFAFNARGDVALKGFDEPTRLYEVDWRSVSMP